MNSCLPREDDKRMKNEQLFTLRSLIKSSPGQASSSMVSYTREFIRGSTLAGVHQREYIRGSVLEGLHQREYIRGKLIPLSVPEGAVTFQQQHQPVHLVIGNQYKIPTAYCLLPIANCLLPTTHSLLTTHCLLPYCLLPAAYKPT